MDSIAIFSDVIDALERIGQAVLKVKQLPKDQRDKAEEAVEEAYSLLEQAILLVRSRLKDR